MLPWRLPNKKVDFLLGFEGLKVLRVLTVVFELFKLSLAFLVAIAVEFTSLRQFLASLSVV